MPSAKTPNQSPAVSPALPDFEGSMKALEALVEQLEHGDLPLEEALKQFEQGVALARNCQAALKAAEQKVEILLKDSTEEFKAET